jgi:hypothetical protein
MSEDVWVRCAPYLQAALDRDPTHSLDDVRREVEAGECQFWPGERCAALTKLIHTPNTVSLHIWLAGGDLEELKRMLVAVEAHAKAWGCDRVLIYGRPGWGRVLDGYSPLWTAICKELN